MVSPMTRRLTLAAGSLLDASATELLSAAGAAGFDGIGLRMSGEHALESPADFAEDLNAAGMTVLDAEVHRIDGDTPDAVPLALIEAAAAVGAEHLLIVSDLDDEPATAAAMQRCSTACRDAGVTPALEYMAWTMPHDSAGAIRLADSTGCVIVVDLLHHLRVGGTAGDLDAIVASGLLGWVQLSDAPLTPPHDLLHEARHDRRAPGDGSLPLMELLAHVPSTVPLSVEVQSDALGRRMNPSSRARFLHDRTRTMFTSRE